MSSLTARLSAALVLLLAVGGALVLVMALTYGRHAAQEAYDRLLIGAANQIADSVTLRGGEIAVDLPVSAFELLTLAPDDRIFYAVTGPTGELVTGYEGLAPPTGATGLGNGTFAGADVRVATARKLFAERAFSGVVDVVVAQTTQARDALAGEITRGALTVMAVAGLLMIALGVFAVRSGLQPLKRIEREIGARESRDLTPVSADVPREIGSLVATINRFMARLDRQVGIMKTVIADASHQLRTPIAALRAQAELAADEDDPCQQKEIVARIHARSLGLSRLADQLLSHAMIIHRADAILLATIDLRQVAVRAVEESDHELFASDADLKLDLPEEPVWCRGDALSLVEASKNLVVNAFRHGRPPATIEVRTTGAAARISVCDSGPGMAAEEQRRLGERGRGVGVTSDSAGIGLAIVLAVTQSHRGELLFDRSPSGDFRATIALPLAPAPA